VAFTPSITNSYTVYGQNGCGTSSAVTNITVAPLPVSISSPTNTVCAGKSATLSMIAAATLYSWTPFSGGGGVYTTQPVYYVNPTVTTIYTLVVSDGTCD